MGYGPVNCHRCFKGLRLPHAARAEPERPVTCTSYLRLLRASPEIAGCAEADRHTKSNNPHERCHTKWKTWFLTALGNIDQARDQRVTGCTTVAEPQVQHVRSPLNLHFRLRPHQLSPPTTLCAAALCTHYICALTCTVPRDPRSSHSMLPYVLPSSGHTQHMLGDTCLRNNHTLGFLAEMCEYALCCTRWPSPRIEEWDMSPSSHS
jgi:hypothetical protein